MSRGERALWLVLAVAVPLLIVTAQFRLQANPLLGALVVSLVVVAGQRFLLAWQTLFGAILLVILFVPIRRYTVGGALPIELEPYRVLIALVLACWFLALCADPKMRLRTTGLGAPILAVLGAILLSLVMNTSRASAVGGVLVKQLSFFLTYFIVLYFIASVIARGPQLDRMLRLLVGGGTVVALLALFEWRTGTNLFNWYSRVVPILQYVDIGEVMRRGGGVRALGSAEHPIALGAALVMLLPLTVYLHQRDGSKLWLGCGGVLTMGALCTGSRTGSVMLVVLLISFLCLKPRQTARLLPMLLPLAVIVQIAMPGTLGTFRVMINPSYVIQEQSFETGTGTGRVADLGPALDEWSQSPFFGQGFGTRITTYERGVPGTGAQILDNQWLSELLEIGIAGTLALLWLFCRAIRRLAQRARSDTGADSWLATALAASLTGYAVAMLTFDSFAFIQVTFFAFIMLGFAGIVTRREAAGRGRRVAV
jgi:polysaccharide biosynthesis protein PslJ